MKLLLLSDLHCDAAAARSLVERARDVDVLVGAGDFAIQRRGIDMTIDVLKAAPCPAVLVAGNGESHEELTEACRGWSNAHVLHGTGATIHRTQFYGLGGGVPVTPFGSWSWDLTEADATELLADCPRGCVLVSHSPPHETVDHSSTGRALGSRALRAAVERQEPVLAVCGHIHDGAGRSTTVGATPVVNAGPRGVVWDLAAGSRVDL